MVAGYFSLTHEKSLVVDGARALIMTFNLGFKILSRQAAILRSWTAMRATLRQ